MEEKKLKIATTGGKVKISVNIPEKIQKQIDQQRKVLNLTRSDWMTLAAMDRLMKVLQESK